MVRRGIGDLGGHGVAGLELAARRDVDQPSVAGAPGPATGRLAFAAVNADENVHRSPDERLVGLPRDRVLDGDEALIAFLDDFLRHLRSHLGGRRARALRILKRVRTGEPGGPNGLERLLEVGFGLTGEADDDVGRDGRFG